MGDYEIVTVRSVPRPGFKSFYRGGHKWPEEGRTVMVSKALLEVLQAEKMIAVGFPQGDPEAGALELVDNFAGDRTHNASAMALEENRRLKAEKAALEALAENDKLKAELDELKAKLAAKAEAAKPAKVSSK